MQRRYSCLVRLLLYVGAVFLGLPVAFCRQLTHPLRQPTERPRPPYHELAIASEGLRLRAWLATGAAPGRPAVLLAHGLGDSLESYVDIADRLRARGHPVLLLDMRGHGGSEGAVTTLGAREREDVRAAIERMKMEQLTKDGLIAMGWSMGAVAVLRACADRNDVSAVVVESPYDTYRENVVRHAWLLYRIPRWVPLIPITIALAERWAGFDADEVAAMAAARRVRAPLLAIADGADLRMPESVVRRVYDAHPGPKQFWVAPGMPHVSARLLPDYWPRVTAFLERYGNTPLRKRPALESTAEHSRNLSQGTLRWRRHAASRSSSPMTMWRSVPGPRPYRRQDGRTLSTSPYSGPTLPRSKITPSATACSRTRPMSPAKAQPRDH